MMMAGRRKERPWDHLMQNESFHRVQEIQLGLEMMERSKFLTGTEEEKGDRKEVHLPRAPHL